MSSSVPASTRRLELFLFAGVLVFYVMVTLLANRPDLIWDEGRYHDFAVNLTQGFFVKPDRPDVINGPGYPLVLAPLVKMGAPYLAMRMVNALFMALAAWFTFRATLSYAGKKWALAVALVVAFHPSLVRTAPYMMTEALAVACISGFGWAFTHALWAQRWRVSIILLAAVAMAWLVMTRVFFGNVILAMLAVILVLYFVWREQRRMLRRAAVIFALALGLCVPWLQYTRAQTGEFPCWSTVGGELLYWGTSTQPGENGHWFSEEDAQTKPELVAAGHRDFYRDHYYLPVPQREAALKKRAFENIRANPSGVVKNWLCNWGRLFFGFPRSHHAEELVTLVLVAVNGPLLLACLFALWLGVRHWSATPPELLLVAAMLAIYVGGTSLLPGLPRYTVVVWPWAGILVADILSRHLRLKATI